MIAKTLSPVDRPSAGTIEHWLVSRVAVALSVEPGQIDVRRPLTSYGLDSLAAFSLAGDLADWLGRELSASLLWDCPTIASLTLHLAAEGRSKGAWSPLVALQPFGSKPPLFLVPQAGGGLVTFSDLAACLGREQPVYGFEPAGLHDGQPPHRRVDQMATCYVDEAQAVQPHGPYFLAGRCFGGLVAFEMAQQLLRRGETVALLAIIDSLLPPQYPLTIGRIIGGGMRWASGAKESLKRFVNPADEGQLPSTEASKNRLTRRQGKLARIHRVARLKYVASTYPGRIIVFQAAENSARHTALQRRWADWSEGGATFEIIPGTHNSISGKPHVLVFAERLKSHLAAAGSTLSSRS